MNRSPACIGSHAADDSDAHRRRGRARRSEAVKRNEQDKLLVEAVLRHQTASRYAAERNEPSVEQRAEQADVPWLARLADLTDGRPNAERHFSLSDGYTTIYRTTSANTHPSPRSLYAYVNPGGAAGRFAIGFMPNLTAEDRYAYTFAPLSFAHHAGDLRDGDA
jgi:hypothetical protein